MTTQPVELVATDLDGTLWGADCVVHPRTLNALDELRRRDIPVIAATGRRRAGANKDLARNGLHLPAVVLNGAFGWDFTRGREFHRSPFSADGAAKVLDAYRVAGLEPVMYVAGHDLDGFVGPRPSTCERHLAAIHPTVGSADQLDDIAVDHPVVGFAALGIDERSVRRAEDAIRTSTSASPYAVRDALYGGHSLMVQPERVSKVSGVVAWCRANDLDPSRVLAVGDAGNDLELLAFASTAVSIVTGEPEAIALADHLVAGPDEGGWADIVDLC